MTAPTLALLDTNVLILLLKGGARGAWLRDTYGFDLTAAWPLVSIVTIGEVRSFARYNGWGDKRLEALEHALANCIPVDINRQDVLDAYVDIDVRSRRPPSGSAIKMGKNDLWIAATAKASGATLYTADGDFDHLHGHLRLVKVPQLPSLPPAMN